MYICVMYIHFEICNGNEQFYLDDDRRLVVAVLEQTKAHDFGVFDFVCDI